MHLPSAILTLPSRFVVAPRRLALVATTVAGNLTAAEALSVVNVQDLASSNAALQRQPALVVTVVLPSLLWELARASQSLVRELL